MKLHNLFALVVLTSASFQSLGENQQGPYLGQTPPGMTPKPFAPGLVNSPYRELSPSFTPDLKEFYLVRKGGQHQDFTLVMFKQEDSKWRESVVMPRIGRPILSPDGNTLHLGHHFMQRTSNGWSEVNSLGPMFEGLAIMRLSSSSIGTLVFDEIGLPHGDGKLRFSRKINGKYQLPREFGKQINNGKYTAHPFISADESYLIWDSQRPDGFGSKDLYISFRQEDGTWGESKNLGDKINTAASEGNAYVTPDGKYFFFSRQMNPDDYDNSDLYWVDAQLILQLGNP